MRHFLILVVLLALRLEALGAVELKLVGGKVESKKLEAEAYLAPAVEVFNDSNVYLTLVPDKVRYNQNEVCADVQLNGAPQKKADFIDLGR